MAGFVFFNRTESVDTESVLRIASKRLAPARAASVERCLVCPEGAVTWKCSANAPVDVFEESSGGFAVIWGEPVAYSEDCILRSEELYRRISSQHNHEEEAALARYSGLYAWMVFSGSGLMTLGADPLGIFPVYYFEELGAFGVATGLSALRAHPFYDVTIDKFGLARYLIEGGSVGERTLECSGRRLGVGESLAYDCRTGRLECLRHPLGRLEEFAIGDERDVVELSVEATCCAFDRHARESPGICLLSGGLDSRHLLGLAVERGMRPHCLTLGRSMDYDSEYARRVARSVGCSWESVDDDLSDPYALVEEELGLQSLGGGFSSVSMEAGFRSHLVNHRRCLSGLFLDLQYSPYDLKDESFSRDSFEYSFVNWINRNGVPLQVLRELALPGEMREAVEEAVNAIRQDWEAIEGEGDDRIQRTIWRFRARPHNGGYAWKAAFHSWPVLPGLDLRLAHTFESLPGDWRKGRCLQRETLRAINPALARIPLVGLKNRPRPIVENWRYRMEDEVFHLRRRVKGFRRKDLHRFPRILKVDAPMWETVREWAANRRSAGEAFFDPRGLAAYTEKLERAPDWGRYGPKDNAGRRMFWAFILWAAGRASTGRR